MKYYVSFFVLLFILAACSNVPYPKLVTKINNTDSVVVNFFEPGTRKAIKHKSSNIALGIDKIKAYISDGAKGEKNTCPVDGFISFYNKGKLLLKGVVQYRNTCWQIGTEQDDKVVYITMPAEGKTFFEALEKDADKNEIILYF